METHALFSRSGFPPSESSRTLSLCPFPKPKQGFPGGSAVKNPPANAGYMGLTFRSGRSSGGGNGNSSQYSCLESSMNRGAWQARVLVVAKIQTRLSDWVSMHGHFEKKIPHTIQYPLSRFTKYNILSHLLSLFCFFILVYMHIIITIQQKRVFPCFPPLFICMSSFWLKKHYPTISI